MLTPRGKVVIPQKYLPYFGAGAVAAATFAYILWGPDVHRRSFNSRSGSKRKVAGLENLGNTCYLNTILQSLAACPRFVKWLSRALRRGCFKGKHNELAYKLSKTLEVVNDYSSSHGGSQVYSPHEVLQALFSCSWRSDRDQQDAHELFQFLLSVLGEDKEPVPSPLPLCDTSRFTEAGRNVFFHPDLHSNIEAELSKVSNKDGESPFRGLLANHLTCTVCGHKNPVTYSSFDCLTLPLPASAFGTLSLECILAKFTQSELVHDVECTQCTNKLTGDTSQPSSRKPTRHAPLTSRRNVLNVPIRNAESVSTSIGASPASSRLPSLTVPSKIALSTTPNASHTCTSTGGTPPSLIPTANSEQRCSIVSPSGRSLPDEDLHLRTPHYEKGSNNTTSTGNDTGSSGLEDQGDVSNGGDVPTKNDQKRAEFVSTSDHGNNGRKDDSSPGSVCQTDSCPDPINNTEVLSNSSKLESLERGLPDWTSLDLNQAQKVDKQALKETPKSAEQRTVESTTQENAKLTQEYALINGRYEELSNRTKDINCLKAITKNKLGVEASPTITNNSLLNDEHVRVNEQTDCQYLNQDVRHDVQSVEAKDSESLPVRTSSQLLGSSEVAPPKYYSTSKPRPSPLRSVTSSTNQNVASEAKPTKSPSIFGKIPGMDGPTMSSSDNLANDIDNENLSPKCRRIFRKQLTLGKLPQCLCIHLQRVTWLSNGLPSRREEHIVFPEYLDMSLYKDAATINYRAQNINQRGVKLVRLLSDEPIPSQTPARKNSSSFIGSNFLADCGSKSHVGFSLTPLSPGIAPHAPRFPVVEDETSRSELGQERMKSSNSIQRWRPAEARYRLASAVVHLGDAYSGHFLTFRRAPSIGFEPLSDNWLCVSDESVYSSTRKEVFSQKAYMLYYQRI